MRQIDQLLERYAPLLEQVQHRPPDLTATAALAAVLHSFYTGVEHIFLIIAKRFDQHTPAGSAWHRELLVQMSTATPQRTAIVSPTLAQELAAYLAFRHFFRHAYAVLLDWRRMEAIVGTLPDVWARAKMELTAFLDRQVQGG